MTKTEHTLGHGWTIEYRKEVGKWELKQGLGHRGMFDSEEQARAVLARVREGA